MRGVDMARSATQPFDYRPAVVETGSLNVPAHSENERAAIGALQRAMAGEVRADDVHRVLYASDASIYEIVPVAVLMPKHAEDLEAVMKIASEYGIAVTARAAGTSLAGQAVGPGFVVDTGRFMTRITDFDPEEGTVRVEPGVIRDVLNRFLRPHGWVFGPDTSTTSRCMIGGMVGNNSCGSNSIRYGTTRDNLVSLDVIFTDGERREIGEQDEASWAASLGAPGVYGEAMRRVDSVVRENAALIRESYPKASIRRRNTGYALDDVADSWLTGASSKNPNLARLLCGSEGTMALTAAATLKLHRLHSHEILVAVHFETLEASLEATVEAIPFQPAAVELMDKRILDLASLNSEQLRNRWFVEGDPGALLIIQFFGDTQAEVEASASSIVAHFEAKRLGYAFPVIRGADMKRVWDLRKAGLGILSGKPGDVKPETIVEDTAVAVDDLPAYIREFARIMAKHEADCVYYAHASVGVLHMRPELNLKDPRDIRRARLIAEDVADLVREFRGSLSGEHGDGRIRGPFVERALGSEVYALLGAVKRAFDPAGLMNPGVIVDAPPMEQDWRYHPGYSVEKWDTAFEYRDALGFQRAVERCNGSGECRRPHTAGGTMCPSYMVTLEERESTRARANLFRRMIQEGPDALFQSTELKDALDLCISCKGCKNDCPASVDMARLKAEFMQGWYERKGTPLGARMFANVTELTKFAQAIPGAMAIANFGQGTKLGKFVLRKALGISDQRTLPAFAPRSFHSLFGKRRASVLDPVGTVLLYVDEFTDRYEPEIGIAAVDLLEAGGYRVLAPKIGHSGRGQLSKGFVADARRAIEANLETLAPYLNEVEAIVGVEPSSLLTLVDEALDLPRDPRLLEIAQRVKTKVALTQDFVAKVSAEGRWRGEWTDEPREILLHGHCHQKSLVGQEGTQAALALPPNYRVTTIASGCCGMAGSFGYEDEHYEVSMAIGEMVLFPAVRDAAPEVVVAAPGTSCRHQIADGTAREARHPIEILRDAVLRRALVPTR